MGFCLPKIPISFLERRGNGNRPGSGLKGDRAFVVETEPCRCTVSRVGQLSGISLKGYNWGQ